EVLLIDSERLLVTAKASNVLTVQRAQDGSVLAAHSNGAAIYAFRSLTVERATNGTTAATHSNGAALRRYAPPGDVVNLALASAIAYYLQAQSGWTGQIGGGEGAIETRLRGLWALREGVKNRYRRRPVGAI